MDGGLDIGDNEHKRPVPVNDSATFHPLEADDEGTSEDIGSLDDLPGNLG